MKNIELNLCIHTNCAVCKQKKDREVFKSALQSRCPETYFCEYAMYKIETNEGREFILPTLEFVCDGRQGYYVMDPYTSRYIYLNKDNFEVICFNIGKCNSEPYVEDYIPQRKKKSS